MADSPKTSTGFVGLQQYLDANQPAIASTAQNLVGRDTAAANTAESNADSVAASARDNPWFGRGVGFDPTTLADYAQTQGNLSNAAADLGGKAISKSGTPTDQGLNSFGGLSNQLQDAYGGNGYTQGDRTLDANLLGSSGDAGKAFGQAQTQFAGLDSYLDKGIVAAGSNLMPGVYDNAASHFAPHVTQFGGKFKAPTYTPPKVYDSEGQSGLGGGSRIVGAKGGKGDQVQGQADDSTDGGERPGWENQGAGSPTTVNPEAPIPYDPLPPANRPISNTGPQTAVPSTENTPTYTNSGNPTYLDPTATPPQSGQTGDGGTVTYDALGNPHYSPAPEQPSIWEKIWGSTLPGIIYNHVKGQQK